MLIASLLDSIAKNLLILLCFGKHPVSAKAQISF
jgi:hypothetical protein